MSTTLGQRVKAARKLAGISRKDAAAKAGMAYSTLADIENEATHTCTRIASLADAIEVNGRWLETGNGSMKPIKAESAAAEQSSGEASGSGQVVAPITHEDPSIAEVIRLMARMSDLGKGIIIGTARETIKSHPCTQQKTRRA